MTGTIEVSGLLLPSGRLAAHRLSEGIVKFVMALLRKNPRTGSHAPKLTLIVVVMDNAAPHLSTIAIWVVEGEGERAPLAHDAPPLSLIGDGTFIV
jgi:hypothetical protein